MMFPFIFVSYMILKQKNGKKLSLLLRIEGYPLEKNIFLLLFIRLLKREVYEHVFVRIFFIWPMFVRILLHPMTYVTVFNQINKVSSHRCESSSAFLVCFFNLMIKQRKKVKGKESPLVLCQIKFINSQKKKFHLKKKK